MDKIVLTTDGFKKIFHELQYLKNEERPNVAQMIDNARKLGDLSENAEYHQAKDRQRLLEDRIKDLEFKISNALVVDITTLSTEIVKFGLVVEVQEVNLTPKDKNATEAIISTFQIVGAEEIDNEKAISFNSPLAKSIMNKKVNDLAEVHTPRGKKIYKILKIRLP